MEKLTSLKNPRVQRWRSLKDAKARRETGLFLVEGEKMVREALASSFPAEALLIREGADFPDPEDRPSFEPALPAFELPEHGFSAICDTKTPQGVAAVLRMQSHPASGPRLVALDGVQDPGNVGTILRTADAAGFDGLLLSPACADVFSPKVLRATMGSIFRLGLSFPPSLPEALRALHGQGYDILSSQLDGQPFFDRPPIADSFVLIIGSEGSGVSAAVSAEATLRLKLPMRGGAESLNAAVAAGIMMYDLTRDLS